VRLGPSRRGEFCVWVLVLLKPGCDIRTVRPYGPDGMCPRGQIITARVLIPCVIILTYPWESVGSAVHFKGFSLLFSLMENRRNEIIIKKEEPSRVGRSRPGGRAAHQRARSKARKCLGAAAQPAG
jgi:hypothetical protein